MEYYENIEKLLTELWNRQDQNLKPFYKALAVYECVDKMSPDEILAHMSADYYDKGILKHEVLQYAYQIMWNCQQAEFLR